jgi:glycerol-3-phosphate dehydrogenase
MVVHPIDYLLRRSSQLLFNFSHVMEVKDQIIAEMADYFDWDEKTENQMVHELQQQIELRQAFKEKVI